MQCHVFAHGGYVRGSPIDGSGGCAEEEDPESRVHLGSFKMRLKGNAERPIRRKENRAMLYSHGAIHARGEGSQLRILRLIEGIQNGQGATGMFRIGKRVVSNMEWYPPSRAPHFPNRLPRCGMTSGRALIDASRTHSTSVCWVRIILNSTAYVVLLIITDARKKTRFSNLVHGGFFEESLF